MEVEPRRWKSAEMNFYGDGIPRKSNSTVMGFHGDGIPRKWNSAEMEPQKWNSAKVDLYLPGGWGSQKMSRTLNEVLYGGKCLHIL